MWFAVPYVVIRFLGMALQVSVDHERDPDQVGISMQWVAISTIGLVVVLAGALVDTPARNWVWVVAIVLDLTRWRPGRREMPSGISTLATSASVMACLSSSPSASR